MKAILITFHEPAAKGLHQELEDSKYREQTFKQAMMKAQSQSDSFRRFIEDQDIEAQFAGFIMISRGRIGPVNILEEFGFTGNPAKEEEKPPTPQ